MLLCLTRKDVQPHRLHGLHWVSSVGALGHADVLASILDGDVVQMQGVHLGCVALQGLHIEEVVLTDQSE